MKISRKSGASWSIERSKREDKSVKNAPVKTCDESDKIPYESTLKYQHTNARLGCTMRSSKKV